MVPSRPASATLFFLSSCPCVFVWLGGSRGAGIVDRISARPLLFSLSSLSQKKRSGGASLLVPFRGASIRLSLPSRRSTGPHGKFLARQAQWRPPRSQVGPECQRTPLGRRWVPASARVQAPPALPAPPPASFLAPASPSGFSAQSSPSSPLAPPWSSILGIFRQVNETLPATNPTYQRHGLRR